jgi:hypothetical protein
LLPLLAIGGLLHSSVAFPQMSTSDMRAENAGKAGSNMQSTSDMREDLRNSNADKCIIFEPADRVATLEHCKEVCGPAVANATAEERMASTSCIAFNGPSQVEGA